MLGIRQKNLMERTCPWKKILRSDLSVRSISIICAKDKTPGIMIPQHKLTMFIENRCTPGHCIEQCGFQCIFLLEFTLLNIRF